MTDYDVAVHGDVAVATYVDDENEVYHGHKLHCRYRTTDTWKKTSDGWRLIAGQVLALRTDPPAISLAASVRSEYCGRYALTPAITYEIRCKGDALEGQALRSQARRAARGSAGCALRARPPAVSIRVPARHGGGDHRGFAQRREAWDLVWKRERSVPAAD